MSRIDHSFDWKGFSFFCKIMCLCVAISGLAYYGLTLSILPGSDSATPILTVKAPLALAAGRDPTPLRVITRLTIEEAVPKTGKFIAADLTAMRLSLYQDGVLITSFPIRSKGRIGTPWETPSGFYSIKTKEETHFSSIGKVFMPYSMQFYGNYFIHGWTYYPDGTPTTASFSGGCIKLGTEEAAGVFAFADVGTKVFVYDAPPPILRSLSLRSLVTEPQGTSTYLVADIDTGDVYAERNATAVHPMLDATRLMTALVSNETISFDKKIPYNNKRWYAEDVVYPLIMLSSDAVADGLASFYGTRAFVRWMNAAAQAFGMSSTTFVDVHAAPHNTTTAEDLYRLVRYLSLKKSFVLKIANTPTKTIEAADESSQELRNTYQVNSIASVITLLRDDRQRRVAVVVLGSSDQAADVARLAAWIEHAAFLNTGAACASCAEPHYRRIEL